MHELLQWILESLRTHGPLSVFVGVIIESIIVPLPSPLIIMGAGAILIEPTLTWPAAGARIVWLIVLPGSLASTLGALFGYGLGYWGGKPLIHRWRRFLGFDWTEVATMETRLITRRAGWMIALLRALPVIPLSLISIAGGLIRWPLLSFIGWTWLGALPRCLLLGYLGWAARDTYEGLAHGMDRLETVVSGLVVLASLGGIFWLRHRARRRS